VWTGSYSAGVNGWLDEELLLLVPGEVDGLGDERVYLIVAIVAGELDVGLVVLLEERGGEVAQAEGDVEGSADGGDVRLLAFLSSKSPTMIGVNIISISLHKLKLAKPFPLLD
jgi:hypothetical protein